MSNAIDPQLQTFESYRPLLFSIAYRMLGTVMEAEDAVQECYLRFMATELAAIQSPKAFLTTVVTRLCLDQLKSARVKREEYIGPWLPEPLLTADAPDELFARHESIAMAFLVLLETLSPVERAVFLLREVFDYDYEQIGAIVEKSESNCRQLYSRARRYIHDRRPRFTAAPQQHAIVENFMTALARGDIGQMEQLLAQDVQLWSDGGGKVSAATRPLAGQSIVLRFLAGIYAKRPADARLTLVESNGAPSLLVWGGEELIGLVNLHCVDGLIAEIRFVVNPDKLQHLRENLHEHYSQS